MWWVAGSAEDIAASTILFTVLGILTVLILVNGFLFIRKYVRGAQRAKALANEMVLTSNPLAAAGGAAGEGGSSAGGDSAGGAKSQATPATDEFDPYNEDGDEPSRTPPPPPREAGALEDGDSQGATVTGATRMQLRARLSVASPSASSASGSYNSSKRLDPSAQALALLLLQKEQEEAGGSVSVGAGGGFAMTVTPPPPGSESAAAAAAGANSGQTIGLPSHPTHVSMLVRALPPSVCLLL